MTSVIRIGLLFVQIGAMGQAVTTWNAVGPGHATVETARINRFALLAEEPAETNSAGPASREPAPDWQQAALQAHLNARAIDQLRRDSLVIAGPAFKQSFDVYTRSGLKPFVTSDALINGFHALWGESIAAFDRSRAPQLRRILEEAWTSLDRRLSESQVSRAEIDPYMRHLAHVIGPALRLLGSTVNLGDAELESAIDADVKRIVAAQDEILPAWLAPADDALTSIDFRRCRPIGLYAGDPVLESYYRAVRWLQMVPIRPDRAQEVGALILWGGLGDVSKFQGEFQNYLEGEAAIFGPANGVIFGPSGLLQENLLDDMHRRRQSAGAVIAGVQFRLRRIVRHEEVNHALTLLPSAALPDVRWFAEIDRALPCRCLPSGAGLAAWLGSSMGRQEAVLKYGAGFAPLVDAAVRRRARERFILDTLPERYFDALASLFQPPEPEAPGFMRTQAWERKSLQTALAGWAQSRHDVELHAEYNLLTFGLVRRPAGFVEPNPEFFRRFGDAVAFAFDRFLADGLFAPSPDSDLAVRWRALEALCHRLEVMAQIELRGVDWSPAEAAVLEDFGESLANIMGYRADGWIHPRDDAPRWVTVGYDEKTRQNAAIGIGRARALYVLYPWRGNLVLCRGAVMSYYEYETPDRLTDEEWRTKLDSQAAPTPPGWLRPLLGLP